MSLWTKSLCHLHERLNTYYWDGKLRWRPKRQLVYSLNEIRPEFVPITAPNMCKASTYDNGGFWDFPLRLGYTVNRNDHRCHSGRCPPGSCIASGERSRYGLQTPAITKIDGGELLVAEKIAFLQAWLFFGAFTELGALCGLALDVEELHAPGNTISTSRLNGLPMRLFVASQRLGKAGTGELRSRLYALARHVQLMITRGGEFEDEHDYTFSECQVLCSIHILLRIILLTFLCQSSRAELDPKEGMGVSVGAVEYDWAPEGQSKMGELMFKMLVEKGWCKSELMGLGFDIIFFAYFIDRPRTRSDHNRCEDTRCIASQTSEEDYETVHVTSGCSCLPVCLPVMVSEKIRDALAKGKIPKIVINQDCELSVVDDGNYPYVAISHVWADGLGNPQKNALPRCQLRRLREHVTVLSKVHRSFHRRPTALWIDTLCIPVDPHLKEYRKLAIRLLGQTFYDASMVLVLDRELSFVKSKKASDLELGIRVLCGGWMKRLWTLQEAALSIESKTSFGKIYFQMQDGPIRWHRLSHTFQHISSNVDSTSKPRPQKTNALVSIVPEVKESLLFGLWVETSINDRIPSLDNLQNAGFNPQYERLALAVQTRSTSKAEDEAICIASLAGLDLSSILGVQTAEERMQQFYLLLREIPMAIIFTQVPILRLPDHRPSRSLTKAPFRWAPASLLSLDLTDVMNVHNAYAAQRFAEDFQMDGICETDGLHIKHNGLVFDADGTMFPATSTFEDNSGEQYLLEWHGHDANNVLHKNLALIFETTICSTVAIVQIEDRLGREDGVEFYVTILGFGSVSRQTDQIHRDVLKVELTPFNQKWCLT